MKKKGSIVARCASGKFVGLFLVVAGFVFCLGGCRKEMRYYEVKGRLHTPYQIKFQYTQPLDREIDEQLKYFYYLFNAFDSTSMISRINRNEVVEVDTLFAAVFKEALKVSEQTEGAYDITSAPLINLWGFGFSNRDSVSTAHIDSVRTFVGYQKVRLDGNRVVKDDPRLILNCSSLADGCVCDMLAGMLESKGITNYMIDFGGEIRVKGVNPRGESWRLGITKPIDDASGVMQEIQQIVHFDKPMGMATSGNYRNFYIKDGRKYAHTIDPREGCPVQRDILGATVVAPEAMVADAYATACMVLGSEGARRLMEQAPEIEYFFICSDTLSADGYRVEYSEGFERYMVGRQ